MKAVGRADVATTFLASSITKAGRKGIDAAGTNTNTNTSTSTSTTPLEAEAGAVAVKGERERPSSKDLLFDQLLNEADVSMEKLRSAAWTRVPDEYRAPVWQLLIGYLPLKLNRREETLQRKRKEYFDCLPRYYARVTREFCDTFGNEVLQCGFVYVAQTPNGRKRTRRCCGRLCWISLGQTQVSEKMEWMW